jgi:hypothetical protein
MRAFRFVALTAVVGLGLVNATGCFDLPADPTFLHDASPETSGEAAPSDAHSDVDPNAPAVVVSASTLDFGSVSCGSSAAPQTLVVRNAGASDLSYDVTLDNVAAFDIGGAVKGAISAGASLTFTVTPKPIPASATAGATAQGALTIHSNDPLRPTSVVGMHVTPSGGALAITPVAVDFGQVPVDAQSPVSVPLVIKNVGNAPISVALGQPLSTEFTVAWSGAPSAVSIAPGASMVGAVARFAPLRPGAQTTSTALTVVGATCGASPKAIALSGQGTTGSAQVSPGSLAFSESCGAGSSPAQLVTVTNRGPSTLTLSNVAASGPFIASAPSNASLLPNESATISVTGNAAVAGDLGGASKSGSLTFNTSDPQQQSVSIALTETIVGANLGITDAANNPIASLDFGQVMVGASRTQTFRLLNTGNAQVSITPGQVASPPWSWGFAGAQAAPGNGGFASLSLTFGPQQAGPASTGVTGQASGGPVCAAPLSFSASGEGVSGGVDAGGPPDAGIFDAGGPPDAGQPPDAGAFDAGFDAFVPPPDAGAFDAGFDAFVPPPDAGAFDAGFFGDAFFFGD